jgi:hypothetical protein
MNRWTKADLFTNPFVFFGFSPDPLVQVMSFFTRFADMGKCRKR